MENYWIVELSNGHVIKQNEFVGLYNPWRKLSEYLTCTNLKIKNLKYFTKNREIFNVSSEDTDGYYYTEIFESFVVFNEPTIIYPKIGIGWVKDNVANLTVIDKEGNITFDTRNNLRPPFYIK